LSCWRRGAKKGGEEKDAMSGGTEEARTLEKEFVWRGGIYQANLKTQVEK